MSEHRTNIAVSIMVVRDNALLLLKRTSEPHKWGPPGGRVRAGESLLDAAQRELKEETGLSVATLTPTSVWSGNHDGADLHAINFVGRSDSGKVVLSDEHSEWAWVTATELTKYDLTHSRNDFENAQRIQTLIENK